MSGTAWRYLLRLGPEDISWQWQHLVFAAAAIVLVPLCLGPLILLFCDPHFAQKANGACTVIVFWGPGAFFGFPALAIGGPVLWALRGYRAAGALPVAVLGGILGVVLSALVAGDIEDDRDVLIVLGTVGALCALTFWGVLVGLSNWSRR